MKPASLRAIAVIVRGHLKGQAMAEAYLNRGLARRDTNRPSRLYDVALRIAPELVAAYCPIAASPATISAYERAVKDFATRPVELKPGSCHCWVRPRRQLQPDARLHHALSLDQAIALDPADRQPQQLLQATT